MNKFSLIFILLFIIVNSLSAQIAVKPKGIYKEIDVQRHQLITQILLSEDSKTRKVAIDSVLTQPNNYNPPVLYALSNALFQEGRKDEATYWFYVGQLRARYDANLCLDKTAKQQVSILNDQFGPEINKYAFQNIDSLEKTVTKVVEFVRNNKENYDQRWISLHGIQAFDGKKVKEVILPEDQWEAVKNKTVTDYYNGFLKYVKESKE